MDRVSIAVAVAVLSLMAGCADLNAVRITADMDPPAAGAPYYLTFTQFEITVTRRVAACKDKDGNADFVVSTNTEIKRLEAPDPKRHYVIDFEELQSYFKSTDVTVEYHENGALKSMNAHAKDETGSVIVSTVSTVAKLVASMAVAGLHGADGAQTGCRGPVEAELAKVKALEPALKAKTQRLKNLTTKLEEMTAIAKALGEAWGKAEQRLFAKAIKDVYAVKADQIRHSELLENALSQISKTTTVKWPRNGETFASESPVVPALDVGVLKKWSTLDGIRLNAISEGTAVWLSMQRAGDVGRKAPCDGNVCPDDRLKGLKYRVPVHGILRVCSRARDCTADDEITKETGLISQLGPIHVLPLHSTIFTDKTVKATFSDKGSPTLLGVQSTAGAATAASTVGDAADQFIKLRAGLATTKLDEVKAETALLQAQKERDDALKALQPAPDAAKSEAAAAFQADTALKEAELANIDATAKLQAARQQAATP